MTGREGERERMISIKLSQIYIIVCVCAILTECSITGVAVVKYY